MINQEKPSFEVIQAFNKFTALPDFHLDNQAFPLTEISTASEKMGYLIVNQPFVPDGLSVVTNHEGEVVFTNLGLLANRGEIQNTEIVWHWDQNGQLIYHDIYSVYDGKISVQIDRYFYGNDGELLKEKHGLLENGMAEADIRWHESVAEPLALQENVLLQELIAAKSTKALTAKIKSIPLENIEELKRVAESWLEDLTSEIETALEEKENLQQELTEEEDPEERDRLRDEIKDYDVTQEEAEKKKLESILALLPPG